MNFDINKWKNPLLLGIGFLFLLICIEYFAILLFNNGSFIYTLDDPYIHMALSENIVNGHYGVNAVEFSAPSSSILWPFVIAPLSFWEHFPFIINCIAALFTIYLFSKILGIAFDIDNESIKSKLLALFLILLILATNIVGLVYTGMEHVFQLLSIIIIVYGLIIESQKGKVSFWFLTAIVIAPLIRYENFAISLPVLAYLLFQKHVKRAFLTGLVLLSSVIAFSLFLNSLGLDFFPSSVSAKSEVVQSGGKIISILRNIKESFIERQGLVLWIGALLFIVFILYSKDKSKKKLSFTSLIALLLHFVAGRYGWYNRYEIYIWSYTLLMNLYLWAPVIKSVVGVNYYQFFKFTFIGIIATIITCFPYLMNLLTIPIASNNIYEQQYQMHRFAVDYYNAPVAVNDLGYVAYKNENYVLDLWGLASYEALKYRESDKKDWMKELSEKRDVGLIMIYDNWFKKIPNEWIKVGELSLGKKRITASQSVVSFYAADEKAYNQIIEKLPPFVHTLPSGTSFKYEKREF